MPARSIVEAQAYLTISHCAAILICTQPIRESTAPRYLAKASSLRGASDFSQLNWATFNPNRVNRFLQLVLSAPTIVYTNNITLPPLSDDRCVLTFNNTVLNTNNPRLIFVREICFRKCMLLSAECADVLCRLVNLEYLDISFTKIYTIGKFKTLRWLKELICDSVMMISKDSAEGIEECPRLHTLDISHTQLVNDGCHELLSKSKSLRKLRACCQDLNRVDLTGMESVIEVDVSTRGHYYRWRDSDDDEDDADSSDHDYETFHPLDTPHLKGMTNLRTLTIDNSSMFMFRFLLPVKDTLIKLCINSNQVVTRTGVMSELIYLNHLEMRDCRSLKNLKHIEGAVSLEYIDFTKSYLIRDVNKLSTLNCLRTLILSKTQIDVKGTAELGNLVALEYLDVSDCNMLQTIDHFVPSLMNLKHLSVGRKENPAGGPKWTKVLDTFTTLLREGFAETIRSVDVIGALIDRDHLTKFCQENDEKISKATRLFLERAKDPLDLNLKIDTRRTYGNYKTTGPVYSESRENTTQEQEQQQEIPQANDDFMEFLS